MLAAWARSDRWSRRGADVMDCRMPGFPENVCGTDGIRKVQKHGVIAGFAGEDFNVDAVHPNRGVIDSKVSDVDEASVSYVDK